MAGATTKELPLLPLRDLIIFPHMMMPLFVGREKSINALEDAMSKQTDIVLAAQKDAKTNNPEPKDIYTVGTLGTIIQLLRLPDGTVKVLVEGKRRVRIKEFKNNESFFTVQIEDIVDENENIVETQAMVRSVKTTFETYVKLNKRIPPEILMRVSTIENPAELGDIIVAQLNLKLEELIILQQRNSLKIFLACGLYSADSRNIQRSLVQIQNFTGLLTLINLVHGKQL